MAIWKLLMEGLNEEFYGSAIPPAPVMHILSFFSGQYGSKGNLAR